MKIKSCEINNFGKISNKTIDFDKKITVIRGNNESGKSTLSYFIKYALYGFCGKGRDERNNEKIKYTPWNGLKSSGTLVLVDENQNVYRTERFAEGKSIKGRILDSSGTEVFKGREAGEVFLGIDSSAFEKSAFVGQKDIEPAEIKNLGASLEKLLLKSDVDDADFDKAKKILSVEKSKLFSKIKNSGKIPELSEKIAQLKEKRIIQSENNRKLNLAEFTAAECEKKLLNINSRLKKLYSEFDNIKAYDAYERLEKINEIKAKCEHSEIQYKLACEQARINGFLTDRKYFESLSYAYSDYLAAVPENICAEKELSDAKAKYKELTDKLHTGNNFDSSINTGNGEIIKKACKNAQTLNSEIKKRTVLAIVFLCLVITFPIAIFMFVSATKYRKKLSAYLKKLGFSNISSLLQYSSFYTENSERLRILYEDTQRLSKIAEEKKIEFSVCEEMLEQKLMQIGYINEFKNSEEYLSDIKNNLLPKINSNVSNLENCEAEYSKNQKAFEALISISDIKYLEKLAALKTDTPPQRTASEVEVCINYDEQAKELLENKLSHNKTEIARLSAVCEDPAIIEDAVFRFEKELSEAKLQNDAIDLALELIDQSREDIRSDVFPAISKRAGELFSKFTNGKYRDLFFDKDYSVKVLEYEDGVTRNVGYLSSGAIDAAYLALRISLADYLCQTKPPLIFDDSFAQTDDERLKNILEVLCELSEEYQIIILTCHNREEKILSDKCRVIEMV